MRTLQIGNSECHVHPCWICVSVVREITGLDASGENDDNLYELTHYTWVDRAQGRDQKWISSMMSLLQKSTAF